MNGINSGLRALFAILLLAGAASAPAAPSMSKSEAQIRQLLDAWARAFRTKDVDAVMAFYAPGDAVVSYDIVPPLQVNGHDSYRKNYEEFFATYDGPVDVELKDLKIVAGNDVAFIHSLERMSGTLKGGQHSELWLRATSGMRKINGKWLIVHDHVSVPADFATGKAAVELKP